MDNWILDTVYTEQQSYATHEDAWASGHRVFRDKDGEVLIISQDGWFLQGFYCMSEDYASYPVTPIGADERLVLR